MKLKKWEEYTDEEKEDLLIHYFYYYGKTFINLDEYEKYIELAKTNFDSILNYALIAFTKNEGPTPLVYAIRKGKQEELLNLCTKAIKEIKDKNLVETITDTFINLLVTTYNHPEPDIPFSEEQTLEELKKLNLGK